MLDGAILGIKSVVRRVRQGSHSDSGAEDSPRASLSHEPNAGLMLPPNNVILLLPALQPDPPNNVMPPPSAAPQAVSLDVPVPPSDFDEEKKEPDGTTESNDALNAFFLEVGIDASLIYSAPAEQKIVRPDQFVQLVKTLERVKKASFTVKDRKARQDKRVSIPANIVTHQAMIRAWVKELKMVNELWSPIWLSRRRRRT